MVGDAGPKLNPHRPDSPALDRERDLEKGAWGRPALEWPGQAQHSILLLGTPVSSLLPPRFLALHPCGQGPHLSGFHPQPFVVVRGTPDPSEVQVPGGSPLPPSCQPHPAFCPSPSGPIRSCCAPPLPTPHLLPLQVRLQLPLTLTFRAAAGLEVGGLGRGALGTRLTVGDASRARSLSGPGHESRRSIYEFAGAQAPAAHSCQARKDRPPRGDGLPRQPAPGPTGWAGPRRPTPTGPPPPQGGAQEGARGGLELRRSRLPAGHRLNPAPPRPPRASIKPGERCSVGLGGCASASLFAHLWKEVVASLPTAG
ncbi:thyroid receptor-interacting protein 6-like [Cavia porcellus]|uniref:thyroid receptor-interacting protein 6-like n=1 Tax=Cavia porcellus TaxID=10141 RepID=UPI002FDFCEBD